MSDIPGRVKTSLTLNLIAKFVLHIGLLFLGFVIAYALRRAPQLSWWVSDPDALRVFGWAALYALIGACVEIVFQLERSAWRYVSMREVVGLARNVTIAIVLFVALTFFVDRSFQLPRSIMPLTWLMSLTLLVGFRMAWRLPHDPSLAAHLLPSWWAKSEKGRTPLLIVGGMADADRQLRLLLSDSRSTYQPVGIITPHLEEVGLRLHGVPFVGDLASWQSSKSSLISLSTRSHAIVFLNDPVRDYGISTERIGELRRAGHRLLKPQSMADIEGTPEAKFRLEEIPLEDFLPRKPIALDIAPVRELVFGRRVMVTGAGGSIGSELCRQLLALGCRHLSMIDHSEFLLFEVDREFANTGPDIVRRAILCNVRDTERVAEIIRVERPDIIFHAAALKHVGLVENNPAEGVLTNVLGTWNVIQAAVEHSVTQFVLISTDKAVAPSNVMGATKRIAEALLDLIPSGKTGMTVVRFGNVLGSAGSVVPIFREQIARGGPVTVTHPEVNRFFMTIPEAVQLVLHSTAISRVLPQTRNATGASPRKFLLEMGQSVRIVDLARQMIELSGKTPDVDVMIEFTGLKPGEKLAEILSDDGEEVSPCVEGIMELLWRLAPDAITLSDVSALVDQSKLAGDLPERRVLAIVEQIRSGLI